MAEFRAGLTWANYSDLSPPVGHPKMWQKVGESPQNALHFRFGSYSHLPRVVDYFCLGWEDDIF